jgi:hypothetical protein
MYMYVSIQTGRDLISQGVLLFLHFYGFLNPGKVNTIVSLIHFIYAEKYLTTEIPNRRYFKTTIFRNVMQCSLVASYPQFGVTRLHEVTSKAPFL